MKGDKYKQLLLDIIDDTQLVIQSNDLPRARAQLDDLAREFRFMPDDAFAGGRSIFAIAYTTYLALEEAYKRKQIMNE
ncbi:hypothetical protein J4440_02490 [Candidatus Woesearchaeota archaeon]|nr:hypothetical protein [Candidatus Woesearchaeota archaeon]